MLCMIDKKSEKRFTQKAWDKMRKGNIVPLRICGYGRIFLYLFDAKGLFWKGKRTWKFFQTAL